ncbi:MAG: S-layer homology domain-containing protein [Clostridiaceae bacterium]|nr:S-layer homology domain-containing protein [Clostridiaceae bacterium]
MPGNAVSINADFTAIPPVLSLQSASAVTLFGATLNYTSDMAGTVYYQILASDAPAPDISALRLSGVAAGALAGANQIIASGLLSSSSYKAYIMVRGTTGADSAITVISFTTLTPSNTIPNRKVSVTGTYSETVTVNNPFSLNLNDIFEDADLDPLTYTVSIAGAAKIAAAANYTYTPAIAGDTVLVFKANDGTAESTDTYTVTVTAADVPPLPLVPLYQFNISVGPGGSITAGFNNTISEGTRLGISATPNSGYVFLRWVSTGRGEFIDSSNPSTTFIMPSEDVIVTAEFIYIGDLDEGLDSGYSASIRGALETMCPVIIDSSGFMANIETSDDVFNNDDNTVIDVSEIPNVLSYSLSLPAQNLSNRTNGKKVLFNSPIAKIELPDNMLSNLQDTHGQKAVITIKKAGKNDLSDKMAKIAGVRPIIQLTLMLDGQEIKWENPEVPVQVAIPYVPTEQELLNPDAITVWAQNDSGEAECVINGRYDPLTGTVTFKTRYFQYFTIGYDEKDINGINDGMWYGKAMKFAAIHDIIKKTDDTYSPYEELSRQQLVVIMLKAYNIPLNDDISDNFTDAVNTDTIRYLAKARKLGISKGIGDNMFNPDGKVSRQEMITMLYRMLMILNELPPMANARQLTDFYDYESIAPWAKEAFEVLIQAGAINGSNGNLYPTSIATKAEFVQIIYNLMKK